jgi:hypothetical protein
MNSLLVSFNQASLLEYAFDLERVRFDQPAVFIDASEQHADHASSLIS